MTHGDDNGLVLPPAVAPTQVIVVPIAQHKPGVEDKAIEIKERISAIVRADIDLSDNSPGWKFAEYEMRGVPLRLEIGPKDIENNCCVIVRRDTAEKITVSLDELENIIPELLVDITKTLYNRALERRESMTYDAHSLEELCDIAENKPGFIRAMWCGDLECEEKLKEVADVTSRCIPFDGKPIADTCVCCGKKADKLLYWGKAY